MNTINQPTFESFSVVDENYNAIPSLVSSDFSYEIYNPSGDEVSSAVDASVEELGSGHYRLWFTPNAIGKWYVVLYHLIYFPWGKKADVEVNTADMEAIVTYLTRVLGLMQENYFLDNTTYDDNGNMTQGRIRLYSNASDVGTNDSVVATYQVESTFTNNLLDTYKVHKI